jgi:phosphoglycolate phosphatase
LISDIDLNPASGKNMAANKYKVIIFDWDGTLVDSTARIVDSMQIAAASVEMPTLTDYAIQQIIGLGLPEALRKLWPQITATELELMRTHYSANFSFHSNVHVDFFPSAHDFFAELQSLGYILAVATGKSRKGLDEMLDSMAVRDVFKITRCADETTSKPDPHMLNEILAELSLTSERALMVGDTSFDLDMAKAINMDSVGMTHGAHESEILVASGAKTLCHDLNDLLEWIKTNG